MEPQLQLFLMVGTKSWLEEPEQVIIPINLTLPRIFLHIIHKQNSMGWYSKVLGFMYTFLTSRLYKSSVQKDWNVLGEASNKETLEIPLSSVSREKLTTTHHLFD